MSAPANHPSLRARLSNLLAELVKDEGGKKIGDICGVDKSTPSRRGGSLGDWPVDDLFALAAKYPELRDAAVVCLVGDQLNISEAIRAQGALFEAMANSAALVAEASRDLADGRIDTDEASRLLPLARKLRDQLAETVLPALEAYRRG